MDITSWPNSVLANHTDDAYFAGSGSTDLHKCLWAFQSSVWQVTEQYGTFLQRLQRKFPVNEHI